MNIALLVGNGLTLDFRSLHSGPLEGWNPQRPLAWNISAPGVPDTSLLDVLPHFRDALAALPPARGDSTDFDVFRGLDIRMPSSDFHATQESSKKIVLAGAIDCEARHFLALSYSHFWNAARTLDLSGWRWYAWLREHAPWLRMCISLNYELLLERALAENRIPFGVIGFGIRRNAVPVLKPHGSIDFDAVGINVQAGYPLRNFSMLNDLDLISLDERNLITPRREAIAVLPNETSKYAHCRWVEPGYTLFKRNAPALTHFIIVGVSYFHCDRPEIDGLLSSLSAQATVIIANPHPPKDLLRRAHRSVRRVLVWESGPEDLP